MKSYLPSLDRKAVGALLTRHRRVQRRGQVVLPTKPPLENHLTAKGFLRNTGTGPLGPIASQGRSYGPL